MVSMETTEECTFQLSSTNFLSSNEAMYGDISHKRLHAAWKRGEGGGEGGNCILVHVNKLSGRF